MGIPLIPAEKSILSSWIHPDGPVMDPLNIGKYAPPD